MKKLLLSLSAMIGMNAIAMEGPQAQATELDPVMVQVHELKAFKSKEALFHERNSFLDAYMNPSSFTELSAERVCFVHHKYPDITYAVSWDEALAHLAQARKDTEAVAEAAKKDEDLPILKFTREDPLRKLAEQQKYQFQIICFTRHLAHDDFDKEPSARVDKARIIANRHLYWFAFDKKDSQGVLKGSEAELHDRRFKNLSSRIEGLRYMTIMQPVIEGGLLVGSLNMMLGVVGRK